MTSQAERARLKKQARKISPAAPRHAPADPNKPRAVTNLPPPQDRDGLLWLIKKKRLTTAQIQVAKTWRDAVRDAGGVSNLAPATPEVLPVVRHISNTSRF